METVLFQNVQTAATSIGELQVQFKRLAGVAKAIEHRALAKELKQITSALEKVVGLSQHLSIMHKTVGEVMYATDDELLKRKVSFQADRDAIREKLDVAVDDVSSDSGGSGDDSDDSGGSGEDSDESGGSGEDSDESGESGEDCDSDGGDDTDEGDETDDDDSDSSDSDTTPTPTPKSSSLQSDSDSDDDWVPKRKRKKRGKCLIVSSDSDSEDGKDSKGETPPTLEQTASALATETINTAIGNIATSDKSNDSSEVTSTGSYDKVSKTDLDK